jgi:hypothetical protein
MVTLSARQTIKDVRSVPELQAHDLCTQGRDGMQMVQRAEAPEMSDERYRIDDKRLIPRRASKPMRVERAALDPKRRLRRKAWGTTPSDAE